MTRRFEGDIVRKELTEYFTNYEQHPETLGFETAKYALLPAEIQKAEKIRHICENARIKVFRYFPFWSELSDARGRWSWGAGTNWGSGIMPNVDREFNWTAEYTESIKPYIADGLLHAWSPVGFDHHCPGYDNILKSGLESFITGRNEVFYSAVDTANKALLGLSARFADEAAGLAESESDELAKANLERISRTARCVPGRAPCTFYEALATIFFIREIYGSLEAYGMSTFGHLDRMLFPYYERDIAAGLLTRDEAKHLLNCLFLYTEVRFDKANSQHETSTTVVIGGCDANGNTVYNDVTDIITEVVLEGGYHGTKLLCRLSDRHPDEFIMRLIALQKAGIPTLMYFCDDTIIGAETRYGKDIHDARLYVGGGCHEIVLANTEVNTRADTWISLPGLLLKTLRKREYRDFEDFYGTYIADVREFHDTIAACKNRSEAYWADRAPAPLYSSSITGCLESGRDVSRGGAKYSSTTLSMTGIATTIDSLYAVKSVVFDMGLTDIHGLIAALDANYNGFDELHAEILYRLPKFGTDSPEVNGFAAKFFSDLSTVSGQDNARGGKYYPGIYPHNLYLTLGSRIGATPDGRLANTTLSRGVSPSEFIEVDSPLAVLNSLSHIDFTAFPESLCLELTLPEDTGEDVLLSLIRGFLAVGGSSLQFNLLDRETLIEARREPEKHKDIIVRVCGYSERFYVLADNVKDEIISRSVR